MQLCSYAVSKRWQWPEHNPLVIHLFVAHPINSIGVVYRHAFLAEAAGSRNDS